MKKVNVSKVCWNITEKCNRNCKHCFRFRNSEELSFDDNMKILNILKENGTKSITWTGGEATLYSNIELLINKSHEMGIYNNLITNGSTLTPNIFKEKFSNLDSITFSLDFLSDEDNIKFGRGDNYYSHLKEMINYLNKEFPNIKIKINTVILRDNKGILIDIYNELKNFKLSKWKLIKFVSFRGTAYKNKDRYATTTDEFRRRIDEVIKLHDNSFEIETVTTINLEENHVMIKPNGDLVKTVQGIDNLLFNILKEGE
jgi:MoaA/NifB/PqqE/SkfB family radical SAM enzyme